MSLLDALILGAIQGLTEFLPVSSSGHLELAKVLLGSDALPKESLLLTVVLHGATALSTLIVFRKDVLALLKGLFSFDGGEDFQFSLKIGLSMIPAGIIGLLFDDLLETLFDGQILFVGGMLVLTGLLLFLADRAKHTDKTVTYKSALLIGIAQAVAILPGISRSGATISTSVLLGIDKERAARFSFLMVVPLILGKMAKDIMDGSLLNDQTDFLGLSVGFISALIVGIFACKWMVALVRKSQLRYFGIYCILIGFVAMIGSYLLIG